MATNLGLGILLVVLGGIMEGTYAVATQCTPRWRWEHIWGAGALMALVLIAWPVTLLTVPEMGQVFGQLGLGNLVAPALFGAAFGAGSIFFGLGVNAVGIAIGVSLIMGLIAVVGSALPMIIYHPEQLSVAGGQLMLAALLVMVIGIVLCGVAGSLREKALRVEKVAVATAGGGATADKEIAPQRRPSFKVGILFCVLSGVLSPMLNFALITGDRLRAIAVEHGASSLWAINVVWFLVFTIAYGVFVLYSLFLMVRNNTRQELTAPGTGKYWLLAAIMGMLWSGGIVLYGVGVAYMGNFGAYAGWPMLLIAAIGASNVTGMIIGEWRGTGTRPRTVMSGALGVLFIAAIMLGVANRMLAA